jgi:hypothetical protein
MKKSITLFLLIISLGLVFAGSAAAAPEVTVEVDQNGTPVNVTSPGEEVNLTANATTDEYLYNPAVLITLDPESGLTFNEDEAIMIYDGELFTNDPNDQFFYWDDYYQAWIWWVGWVYGDQYPGEDAQLFVPATVSALGKITVNADYMRVDEELNEPIVVATDSYTFLSVEPTPVNPVNGETIPMQNTGVPVALAALSLLSIIGGTLYGKLR